MMNSSMIGHDVVVVVVADQGDVLALQPLLELEGAGADDAAGSWPVLPGSFGHSAGGTLSQMCLGMIEHGIGTS